MVFSGTPSQLLRDERSLTGAYLSGKQRIGVPTARRKAWEWLEIIGAREHNLKNVDAKIPLGTLCAVTGVSGAGKSSLINAILRPALMKNCTQPRSGGRTIASLAWAISTRSSPSISSRSAAPPQQPRDLHQGLRSHPQPVR